MDRNNWLRCACPVIVSVLLGVWLEVNTVNADEIELNSDLEVSLSITSGTFSFITYNTAGLPPFINGFNDIRHYQIGDLLNDYDIAVVQEDFLYHLRLTRDIAHPFRSPVTAFHDFFRLLKRNKLTHDGLHRFSQYPIGDVEHIAWGGCFGVLKHANDCLATKGFTVATHELAPGVKIDIYNLHHEAGGSERDHAVRVLGVTQLLERFEISRLNDRAVIVAGDWNLRRSDEMDVGLLDQIEMEGGLTDVTVVLGEEDAYQERIDRIYFRNSTNVTLSPYYYAIEAEKFRDENGDDLSDHEPIVASFEWVIR